MSRHATTYRRATRAVPCPICGKPDWCRVSPDRTLAVCNRVTSDRPARGEGGGWLHRVGGTQAGGTSARAHLARRAAVVPRLSTAELIEIDRHCRADLRAARLDALADRLNVSASSLRQLGIGWHTERRAFTFPMCDPRSGRIVGIRVRSVDGAKRCLLGSRLGLIGPPTWLSGRTPEQVGLMASPDVLVVTEGESDAAAALDLGLDAIARPGCETCVEHCVALVASAVPGRVVIVADADPPGQHGADALARRIVSGIDWYRGTVRVLTLPGAKDLRAWKSLPGADCHAFLALLDAPAQSAVTVDRRKAVHG